MIFRKIIINNKKRQVNVSKILVFIIITSIGFSGCKEGAKNKLSENKGQYKDDVAQEGLISDRTYVIDVVGQKLNVKTYQSRMGGGGYIPGFLQHPIKNNVLFARCDVGGTFKSVNGGKSWRLINNGLYNVEDHFCHSLVINPHNPSMLLRASGDVRGWNFVGRIHRSLDEGETWELMSKEVDFFGNGPTRVGGEIIAFHPEKENIVVVGGYSKGVWISYDFGETWDYAGLKGERISFVKFNPFQNNRLYVGTMGDDALLDIMWNGGKDPIEEQVAYYQDKPRGNYGRLFKSDDLGKNWDMILEKEHFGFPDIAFIKDPNIIHLASNFNVLRSADGGKSWKPVEDLPTDSFFQTIVQSPIDSLTLFTADKFNKTNPIPIYKSTNKGETWSVLGKDYGLDNIHEYPDYINKPGIVGQSIAHIVPDNKDPNKIYFSNYWGVNVTYDNGKNFYGHHFKGLELVCSEDLILHPTKRSKLAITIADHSPKISNDFGVFYKSLENNEESSHFPSRAVAFSKHDSNFILWAAGNKRYNYGFEILRSFDNGVNVEVTLKMEGNSYVQALQEDPIVNGKFWALIEGNIDNQAGVYTSLDFGKTWKKTNSPFPKYIKTLPHEEYFIDKDMLPVVAYQFKNGSGTNQLVSLDNVKKNCVYVGEWTEGLWRSFNGGETWKSLTEKLPFKKNKASIISVVKSHPKTSGLVYAGFWKEGLWKSTDFGNNWEKIFPKGLEENFNVVSLDIDINSPNIMVLACSDNMYSNVNSQILLTFDAGQTWTNIYDAKSLGSIRWQKIAIDAKKERIYAASVGNGIFYFDYSIITK